jgi:hypothetical protein
VKRAQRAECAIVTARSPLCTLRAARLATMGAVMRKRIPGIRRPMDRRDFVANLVNVVGGLAVASIVPSCGPARRRAWLRRQEGHVMAW